MEEQNPWWVNEVDEVYEEWKEKEIRWVPKIIEKISLKPFSLNFLVGPRQTGKTTAIKILINKLLEKVDPRAVFYFSCDEVVDFHELGEVLDNYLSMRRSFGIKSSFIFLDEINFVEEWYRAIKSRIDQRRFKNDVITVTGSSSVEILKEKERFPGRRGNGRDLTLLPLSFVAFFRIATKKEPFYENINNLEKTMKKNMIFDKKACEMLYLYTKSGGFPLPVVEILEKGRISEKSIKTYLEWIKNDWKKFKKNEKYMKEILELIITAGGSPVSWLWFVKNSNISSVHTVADYMEILQGMFVIKILEFMNLNGKVIHRKNKKIHFFDPFIYRVLARYVRKEVKTEHLLEGLVASHLSRKNEVFYWRNSREVDVLCRVNGKIFGFEVKSGLKSYSFPKGIRGRLLNKENLHRFLMSIDWED